MPTPRPPLPPTVFAPRIERPPVRPEVHPRRRPVGERIGEVVAFAIYVVCGLAMLALLVMMLEG